MYNYKKFFFYFSVFYGLIIGRNRETLKNLEYQTQTRIKIPGSRENNIICKFINQTFCLLNSIRMVATGKNLFNNFKPESLLKLGIASLLGFINCTW